MLDSEFACKPKKTWHDEYTVVYSCAAFNLLCFREANDKGPSIINRTPEAGHASWIASFAENQSLIRCQLDNTLGGVYAMEQKSATFLRAFEGIDTLQKHIERAIYEVNDGPVHLIGLCQGGWVAALFTTNYPHLVSELTIAAAPIDTSFKGDLSPQGERSILEYDMAIAMQGGLMLGYTLGKTWEYPNKEKHAAARKLPENRRFYQWYDNYQNCAGAWVRWAADNIFINNRLPDMLDILCPVNVVVGVEDKTTPAAQTVAIQNNCMHKVRVFETPGGHLGVFMGRRSIRDVWPQVFQDANL